MYNLNELAFEAMLENLKHTSNGNPFAKFAVDSMSYEYNRQQYNDCIRHINDENNQIINIYNQISQRGGFITPQEQMEHEEELQRVHQLFNRLPEKFRTALQLRDIEGMTYRQAAEAMNMTEELFKVTLHRARKNLRSDYEKDYHYGL